MTPPYPLAMLLTLCYATPLIWIIDTPPPIPLVMLLTLCYAMRLVWIIDTPLPPRNATNIVLRNTSCLDN